MTFEPIAEIVQRTGLNLQAATFIGSSPIRRYTENGLTISCSRHRKSREIHPVAGP